ncbi:MAG: hypothetical protein D6711_00095 [Chloroflexi bacterium]|nr:MAG: hypothetical protein D6711_00095 [Chloroflexota bacterium]
MGNKQGIFYYWNEKGYGILEDLLIRFPNAVAIFDAQGDLRKPRELAEKYPGRIKFAWYGGDRLGGELVRWKEESSDDIIIDRNRMIQHLIDEFTLGNRIHLYGSEPEWEQYWQHFKAIYRVVEENEKTLRKRFIWRRNGDDHLVHCTNYWRAGIYLLGESGQGGFI